jgi:RNA polymerase-binding transcription factor DksA
MAKHKKSPPVAKKKPAPKAKVTKTAPKKKAAPAPKKVAVKKSVTAAPPRPHVAPTAEPRKKSPVSNSEKKPDKAASARDLLRSRILGGKKSAKPIAFSLDEVREIAKTTAAAKPTPATEEPKVAKAPAKTSKTVDVTKTAKPAQPNHIKAASLADILGFNPKKAQQPVVDNGENVPEKFRRFYKVLMDLRLHLTEGLNLHTEETLKRSSKDDSGDLSSYGQHMADAGTDTFDRDFALSLVSSEQEALTEIDAAIKRIREGTYGICEVTGKPIAKERLLAVPFTRYSAEAQKDIEKNRMRTRTSAGLFGELGEEGAKIAEDDGGDD